MYEVKKKVLGSLQSFLDDRLSKRMVPKGHDPMKSDAPEDAVGMKEDFGGDKHMGEHPMMDLNSKSIGEGMPTEGTPEEESKESPELEREEMAERGHGKMSDLDEEELHHLYSKMGH